MSEQISHKVKLVYHNLENEIEIESVWAEKVGDYYKIKNFPFFAPGLAYDDLISVEEDNGELFFDALIEESGHSTIQIIFFKPEYLKQVTQELIRLNCGWEGSHLRSYISVNVPPEVDYKVVRKYLDQNFDDGVLDFKEACLAHK